MITEHLLIGIPITLLGLGAPWIIGKIFKMITNTPLFDYYENAYGVGAVIIAASIVVGVILYGLLEAAEKIGGWILS